MKHRPSKSRKLLKTGYVPLANYSGRKKFLGVIIGIWFMVIFILSWTILFISGFVTFRGVPAFIIGKFLQDPTAVAAFFLGNKYKLHNRLQELGIEEDIKAYYRPQISDEIQLDQYIHQLLYDATGYVGNNYWVNREGTLILKPSGSYRLNHELQR